MIKKFEQEIRTRNSIKNFDHWARAVPRPVGQNGARAGSWTVYQGPYRTKCKQDRVRDWVPSLVWDEMRPRQGQVLGIKAGIGRNGARTGSGVGPIRARTEPGTGYQDRYWTRWGQDRVREWSTKAGFGRNRGRTRSGTGSMIVKVRFSYKI